MKKIILTTAGILLVLIGTYFVSSGFLKNGSVFIDDYSISDDGKEITINIGVASSAGYIRELAIHRQHSGKLYIDCYSAFGGINGSIGAKTVYTLPLDESTTMIAIYRDKNAYQEMLEKEPDGTWRRVKQLTLPFCRI